MNKDIYQNAAFEGNLKEIIIKRIEEKEFWDPTVKMDEEDRVVDEKELIQKDFILEVNDITCKGVLPCDEKYHDQYVDSIGKDATWIAMLIYGNVERSQERTKLVDSEMKGGLTKVVGEIKEIFNNSKEQSFLLVDCGFPILINNADKYNQDEDKSEPAKRDWKIGDFVTYCGRLNLYLPKELQIAKK
ncbi:hypothetical protein ACFLQI_01660 [Candidatus Undinarchaeota archaeon]